MSTQQDTRATGSLQLGVQKYLYTGYFVGGCIIAYLVHQVIERVWGEGHDTATTAAAVVVGLLVVVLTWKNVRIRTLAQEVVDELAKVTWPTRQETYTATVVVIGTSVVSALVIFVLDRFWNWFTDFVFR